MAAGHGKNANEKAIGSQILAGLLPSDTDSGKYFAPSRSGRPALSESSVFKDMADEYRIACVRVGVVLTAAQKKELNQMRLDCGSPDYSKYMSDSSKPDSRKH